MKKKLFGLTLALAMVLGLNVVVFAGGDGGWPPDTFSIPICISCNCQALNQ